VGVQRLADPLRIGVLAGQAINGASR